MRRFSILCSVLCISFCMWGGGEERERVDAVWELAVSLQLHAYAEYRKLPYHTAAFHHDNGLKATAIIVTRAQEIIERYLEACGQYEPETIQGYLQVVGKKLGDTFYMQSLQEDLYIQLKKDIEMFHKIEAKYETGKG